jgi:N,N'-diacetylchitobiose transport system substrate-binding protein
MARRMRVAGAVLAMAATAAAVAASSTLGATTKAAAKTLTVWLQTDAQATNWAPIVNAANSQFEKENPGWTVNVQYQTWGTHLQKFDATLAGGNTPDVIEMGNTEMTKYMAAGAFADLTSVKASFPNSSTWLQGLAASGRYNGHTYGIPYYAGSRVVTYRTDLFSKAGIKKPPTSLAEFTADAKKLAAKNKAKSFSPVYIAGTDWYVAMSFVYDYGGSIAKTQHGKWVGTLDSKKSMQGLAAYKAFFDAASRASKTTDEAHPNPYVVYGQGQAAAMIGPAWFSCCVGKFGSVTKQFVMPSHTAGQPMPGFLGGSDLAVPAPSPNKAQAIEWLKIYTGTASEKALEAIGNIPNSTTLFTANSINEQAAKRSWFVPTAKNWVNVENGNILRNMLAQILTGKLTIKQAAASASDNITSVLNAP